MAEPGDRLLGRGMREIDSNRVPTNDHLQHTTPCYVILKTVRMVFEPDFSS